jgi:hypothetical protein
LRYRSTFQRNGTISMSAIFIDCSPAPLSRVRERGWG